MGEEPVDVSAQDLSAPDETQRLFSITIEDDGPGIPEDKAREALKRGKRLDETKPGTGLGLAIVADLVNEYGGRLMLERSELGGLKAIVRTSQRRLDGKRLGLPWRWAKFRTNMEPNATPSLR